jgi:hypothetical protein
MQRQTHASPSDCFAGTCANILILLTKAEGAKKGARWWISHLISTGSSDDASDAGQLLCQRGDGEQLEHLIKVLQK